MSIKQNRQPEAQSVFSSCVVKPFRGGLIGCGCHPKMNVGGKKLINGSSGSGGQAQAAARSVVVSVPGIVVRIVLLLV